MCLFVLPREVFNYCVPKLDQFDYGGTVNLAKHFHHHFSLMNRIISQPWHIHIPSLPFFSFIWYYLIEFWLVLTKMSFDLSMWCIYGISRLFGKENWRDPVQHMISVKNKLRFSSHLGANVRCQEQLGTASRAEPRN